MVQVVAGMVLKSHSDSSFRTPTHENFHVPNMCSPIGWKWAQREDAEWMLEDFIHGLATGKMWGLDKNDLE